MLPIKFKKWFEIVLRDLENDYEISREVGEQIGHNATEELGYDPFCKNLQFSDVVHQHPDALSTDKVTPKQIPHDAVNSKNATHEDFLNGRTVVHGIDAPSPTPPSDSGKRQRLGENEAGGESSENKIPPKNPALNFEAQYKKAQEAPEDFVDKMINEGKWKKVVASSVRNNNPSDEKYAGLPPHEYTYVFVVEGECLPAFSTYHFKEIIKSAGYTHYSKSDRGGWVPFKLPGGKVGFGKPANR